MVVSVHRGEIKVVFEIIVKKKKGKLPFGYIKAVLHDLNVFYL
jgi:hypothetical protein